MGWTDEVIIRNEGLNGTTRAANQMFIQSKLKEWYYFIMSSQGLGRYPGLYKGSQTWRVSSPSVAQNLVALAKRMRREVEVRDRHFHLKRYTMCFVGRAAVTWLMHVAATEAEAVAIGNAMMQLGLLAHVVRTLNPRPARVLNSDEFETLWFVRHECDSSTQTSNSHSSHYNTSALC